MGETLLPFATSFNASLSVEARPEHLTGDAGAVLVREVIERTGILEWMTARLHDPRQPHLITYPLAELLRTVLVLFAQSSLCCTGRPRGWLRVGWRGGE